MTDQHQMDWSKIETWLFDLDNTLYPASNKLFEQMGRKINEYVMHLLDLDYELARQVQKKYCRAYGTTLRGLMIDHDIDPYHYMSFVHDLDVSILQIDKNLQDGLDKLPGRKIIFTNASVKHAENILSLLGIQDQFNGIFDIVAADFIPKPEMSSYQKIIETYQINPVHTAMLEDKSVNLVTANALGMTTILIRDMPDFSDQTAEIDAQAVADKNLGRDISDSHIDYLVQNLGIWLQQVCQEIELGIST